MDTGSNKLAPLDEFVVYETKYYQSYTNLRGEKITYRVTNPTPRKVSS